MTVFAIFVGHFETYILLGIYSTRELAEAALRAEGFDPADTVVAFMVAVELDAAPVRRDLSEVGLEADR